MHNRYRVQASEATALALVVQQLISRLRDKAPSLARKLSYSLAQPHLQLVMDHVDTHFAARLKMRDALVRRRRVHAPTQPNSLALSSLSALRVCPNSLLYANARLIIRELRSLLR
jgi:hypothetical protein